MKVCVPSVFVTKFYEEWKLAGEAMVVSQYEGASFGEQKVRLERVLERMAPELARVLKHQLLEALLAETAARLVPEVHSLSSTEIPVDSSPVA